MIDCFSFLKKIFDHHFLYFFFPYFDLTPLTFSNLNTHVQSLTSEYILISDTSMMIPPVTLAGRHFNGPISEPRSVTLVFDELTGAPNVISVELSGQTRRDAYTD